MAEAFYKRWDRFLKTSLHHGENFDVVRREVGIASKKGLLYYLSSLVSEVALSSMMEGLKASWDGETAPRTLFNGNVFSTSDPQEVFNQVMNGVAVLILEKRAEAILIDTRLYPSRAVSEPTSEQTIRGSRDGFGESISMNVGLIRRRIRDEHLMFQSFQVSSKSDMTVVVAYLSDRADLNIVHEITQKIASIEVESLVMSDRALEELLFKERFSPFPLVRYSERPDVASINIMNGKVVILVDTSASAIITPTAWIDHTRHVEEFRQSPLVGTFTRLLRSIAVLLSFLLLPLWLALIGKDGFDNGLPTLMSVPESRFVVVQILIAELIFELLRIASIHTPSQLTSAVGLIAAIVLSQVSLDLGLFLPEILLMCSISAICGFATPSYELSMANKVVKLSLIIIVAFLGKVGLLIALVVLFLYLSTLKTWGQPYLYPFCPFDGRKARDLFMRTSAAKKDQL